MDNDELLLRQMRNEVRQMKTVVTQLNNHTPKMKLHNTLQTLSVLIEEALK